ncbi:MAG: tyrosine-type recombinase/integrase [Acidimicrobiia bacterium]
MTRNETRGKVTFGTPKNHQTREVPLPRFLVERIAVMLEGVEGESEMPTGLRVHDLRHTAASLALSSGASVKAVQQMLGHSSATLTLERHSHLYGDDLDALADRLDERDRVSVAARVRPKPASTVVSFERSPETL